MPKVEFEIPKLLQDKIKAQISLMDLLGMLITIFSRFNTESEFEEFISHECDKVIPHLVCNSEEEFRKKQIEGLDKKIAGFFVGVKHMSYMIISHLDLSPEMEEAFNYLVFSTSRRIEAEIENPSN